MRYIIKIVSLCPEGEVVGTKYLIAENEKRMEAVLSLGLNYEIVTCLGPEAKLYSEWEKRLKKIE